MENIKIKAEWECKKCFFKTNRLADWKRHIKTLKHKKLYFMCTTCDKVFNNRQGLYRHKKSKEKCISPIHEKILKLEKEKKELEKELNIKNEIINNLLKCREIYMKKNN